MDKKQLQSQIKLAADTIEAQQAEIESLKAKLAAAEADKAQAVAAKTAAEKDTIVKVAADKALPIAKVAADRLFEKGMFSTPEKRDQFLAKVAGDHLEALQALAKATEYVDSVQKVGTVVESNTSVETADDVWNKHASAALNRLPGASVR